MQFGAWRRQAYTLQSSEQQSVAALHQIVPALVRAVDGALDLSDLAIRGTGGSCLIFDMPQLEVRQVLVGEASMNSLLESRANLALALAPARLVPKHVRRS